jgi:hypothetical protein
MKITEPYSPTARAKASAKPVNSAGSRIGRITWRKVCQRCAPKLVGSFLKFRIKVFKNRLHGTYDKRQADED